MAEIKLNEGFLAEVAAFREAGAAINTDGVNSVSAQGLSLPTVDAYLKRLYDIWGLMVWFQSITGKDARQMEALAERLKAADMGGR